MPERCDTCFALERWLRGLELDVKEELEKREHGFSSPREEQISRLLVDYAVATLAKIQELYRRHQQQHHVPGE